MAETKIQDLVFSFMDLVGITYQDQSPGVWAIKIPEKERGFFNGFGELVITFDREMAVKHRDLELVAQGSYLLRKIIDRLEEIPRVSRLYADIPPDLPPVDPRSGSNLRVVTPGKVHYRQQVLFNFKLAINCDVRKERHFSALADPAQHDISLTEGLGEFELAKFKEDPDPGIPVVESGEDHLRLYLQACRALEGKIEEEIREMRVWAEKQFDREFNQVNEFLEEQKQELRKKKENVCFHLYFFQKEEEIDRMIADLDQELERKRNDLREKYQVTVEIQLVNALVLCIPTIGQPVLRGKQKTQVLGTGGIVPTSPGPGGEACLALRR